MIRRTITETASCPPYAGNDRHSIRNTQYLKLWGTPLSSFVTPIIFTLAQFDRVRQFVPLDWLARGPAPARGRP